MPNLDSILFDTLLLIIQRLDVRSVIQLSMTSRRLLNDIQESRPVWVNVLLQTAHDAHLMPHTFPIESMTTEQLRRSATRSHRLLFAMSGHASPNVKLRGREIQLALNIKLDADDSQRSSGPWNLTDAIPAYLVPGGRWLVNAAVQGTAQTKTRPLRLLCWDLAARGVGERIEPVSSLLLPNWEGENELAVQADPERKRLVILVCSKVELVTNHSQAYILSLNFSDDSSVAPRFSLEKRLSLAESPSSYYLAGTTAVISQSGPILIWDWAANTQSLVRVSIGAPNEPDHWWLQDGTLSHWADSLDTLHTYNLPYPSSPDLVDEPQTDVIRIHPITSRPLLLSGVAATDAIGVFTSLRNIHAYHPFSRESSRVTGAVIALRDDVGDLTYEVLLMQPDLPDGWLPTRIVCSGTIPEDAGFFTVFDVPSVSRRVMLAFDPLVYSWRAAPKLKSRGYVLYKVGGKIGEIEEQQVLALEMGLDLGKNTKNAGLTMKGVPCLISGTFVFGIKAVGDKALYHTVQMYD